MSINNKHTEAELIVIYEQHYGNTQHASFFLKHYEAVYNDVINEPGFLRTGEVLKDQVVTYTVEFYLEKFISCLKSGHNEIWSHKIAESMSSYDDTIMDAYNAVKEIDANQAKKELIVYSKSIGRTDILFQEYFTFLIEEGDVYSGAVKMAIDYCNSYKKQIDAGRSHLFAHQYADYFAEEKFTEIYCYARADAYEKAILQKKSKKYADVYAEMYGEYVANNYSKIKDIEKDPDFGFYHDEIMAHMKAWEYIQENKLEDRDRFISKYKTIYLNTYYSEKGLPDLSIEEIDAQILKKALGENK